MVNFAEAMQALLHKPEGEKVQVIYLRTANGKILVFLGAPISQEDFDSIQGIAMGECVPAALIGLAGTLGSNTAQ